MSVNNTFAFLLSCLLIAHLHAQKSDLYFKLKLNKGDQIGNIFSRTISTRGDGFTEIAGRISGTAVYTVLDNYPDKVALSVAGHYDGRPEAQSKFTITLDGKTTVTDNGKASESTDASGFCYNVRIWGVPPADLNPGTSWNVTLSAPWELGGPGIQKVTVLSMDQANHTITLQREGEGAGNFDNDAKQMHIMKDGKNLLMDIQPGPAHWTGYTIVKDGLIVSDELLVTRPLTLTTDSLKLTATQRQYILLNQMPVSK